MPDLDLFVSLPFCAFCSLFVAAKEVITSRGPRAYYSGLPGNLLSSFPISAIYTSAYEHVKVQVMPHLPTVRSLLYTPWHELK